MLEAYMPGTADTTDHKHHRKVRDDGKHKKPHAKPQQPEQPQQCSVLFAPYVESWSSIDLSGIPCAAITLAFLLGTTGGKLAFDGTMPVDAWRVRAKHSGKTIVLSFGGASGTELANIETDPKRMAEQYSSAASLYGATRLDFDIEGSTLGDKNVVSRRNKALALLGVSAPHVALQYTLPVMPEGLDKAALDLLRDAKSAGVRLSTVNVMAMDYGSGYTGNMGEYAIRAATSTKRQLEDLAMSDVTVGITPMIGVNDVRQETFGLKDAERVARFARDTPWISFLGFWAVGRDNGRKVSLDESSLVDQAPYEFITTITKTLRH